MKIPFIKLGALLKLVLLAVVLIPGGVSASDTTSGIRGKIVSGDGGIVANANITVLDERTGIVRQYQSNDTGTYYAARLPVGGPYKITVNGTFNVTVASIALGDIYTLNINLGREEMEEVITYGDASGFTDLATGPSAAFSTYDLENAVAIDRDIKDVYSIDPRINLDADDRGTSAINCAGKHPRFNSITLDGVSHNDRFGLNDNGYSTATGMPFPFDAIEQVSVELAPFDVTYGGFSACNINAVTKSGSNEWDGNVFYEFTTENFRGESLDGEPSIKSPAYDETKWGFTVGGPIIEDKLFFFTAYEKAEEPRFNGMGPAGSGIGVERPWLDQATFSQISQIAQSVYNYDTGGAPSDGTQENESYMVKVDWNINEDHNAAIIYNYFDGFQDRASDGDSNEFEFSNHYYVKGSETKTLTLQLSSQWTDALSTEFRFIDSEMNDLQKTRGPGDFADFQITVEGPTGRNTVYLGADDSRQANSLSTASTYFRGVAEYLWGDHVITAGYENEELDIFNIFVQHSRGGEYDFFDDSFGDPAACAALDAAGRFADPTCGLSGIDRFELGRPSRIYYGSAGGTNSALDAAASFSNTQHSLFIQDEWIIDDYDLTVVYGLRYERFASDDRPNYNAAVSTTLGIRNDENIDGVDILMPRIGFTWEPSSDLSVRGGLGLYSGGNPNVWLSNAWSNDGITNVQLQLRNFGGSDSVLDGTIPLQGTAGPGRAAPQALFDQVAATTAANGSDENVVLLDPNYEQPSEWKFALGATYVLPWMDIKLDVDWLHSEIRDGVIYFDVSQDVVGTTILGQPRYNFVRGENNLMLSNTNDNGSGDSFSVVLSKDFDWGLDLMLGYAFTDAEDASPMTSFTAGSSFDNLATLDINDPGVGNSNYVVPHRFTMKATYSHDFFDGYTTRATVYGYAQEGQPQSYVMDADSGELQGFRSRRHLLYVPSGPNDPNVVFGPNFDQAAFFAYANSEDLGSGFVERNSNNAKWSYRMDMRITQELPTFVDGVKGQAFVKIHNLTNLLNDDWGKQWDAQFFSLDVVDVSIDSQGRYVYERFSPREIDDLLETRSLWEVRFGLELKF